MNYQFLNLVLKARLVLPFYRDVVIQKADIYTMHPAAPAMKALLSRFVDLFLCPHGEPQIFYFQEKHVLQILSPPVSLSKSNPALFSTNLCLRFFEYRFKGTFHEYSFFPCVLKPAGKICVISYSYGKMGHS